VDQDLRDLLTGMESRLNASFEAQELRVREQVGKVADDLELRLREQVGKVADNLELRLRERIEKVETTLLTEFWKWARTNDVKLRQHGQAITAFDERLSLLEERITAIESRGHYPLNPKAN
jgi:uncharacterized protein YjbJ (UPF0337 family)